MSRCKTWKNDLKKFIVEKIENESECGKWKIYILWEWVAFNLSIAIMSNVELLHQARFDGLTIKLIIRLTRFLYGLANWQLMVDDGRLKIDLIPSFFYCCFKLSISYIFVMKNVASEFFLLKTKVKNQNQLREISFCWFLDGGCEKGLI